MLFYQRGQQVDGGGPWIIELVEDCRTGALRVNGSSRAHFQKKQQPPRLPQRERGRRVSALVWRPCGLAPLSPATARRLSPALYARPPDSLLLICSY